MKKAVRLDKFLADAGAGTRSEVKKFIQKGKHIFKKVQMFLIIFKQSPQLAYGLLLPCLKMISDGWTKPLKWIKLLFLETEVSCPILETSQS